MREHAQTLSSHVSPDHPGRIARRLGDGEWRNGRLALGVVLVLTAVLGGAAVLRQADRTVTVLAAGRDLPSGIPLRAADLRAVRVRLPAEQLVHYARPSDRDLLLGGRLATGLPKDALVPIALIARGQPPANLVEYPIPVGPGAVPGNLRPGDRVAVVVAGGAADRGLVLLPAVEVLRLVHGGDRFAGDDRVLAVEVRMPKERLAAVAEAVADGQVSLARLAVGDLVGAEARPGQAAGSPADGAADGAGAEDAGAGDAGAEDGRARRPESGAPGASGSDVGGSP